MKYEILIFDADETLFDFKKSEKEAFKNTMLHFNIDYDENYHFNIYHKVNEAIWKEFEQGLITQEKLKTERFRRFAEQLKMSIDEKEMAQIYMEHLSNASFLYEGCKELISSLSPTYRLCIVTNGLTLVQNRRIRKSEIANYFDAIVISEEISIAKPNPGIFEYALQQMNFSDKSKVLVIGDSLSSDIRGGVNFGVDTCWYNPKQLKNDTLLHPTYEVADYSALKALL
jgi:putative hydrolase of the HAD superfamily